MVLPFSPLLRPGILMFSANRSTRRDPNPTGKLQHVRRPGLEHHQSQTYQGFEYQVDRRSVGMTVKRIQFSVNIREGIRQVAYLTNLTSDAQAHRAAREWIDSEIKLRSTPRSRDWQQLGKKR